MGKWQLESLKVCKNGKHTGHTQNKGELDQKKNGVVCQKVEEVRARVKAAVTSWMTVGNSEGKSSDGKESTTQ